MKKIFSDISIKRKLVFITMLTSVAVLLLASAAFLINDLVTFRNSMIYDLETLSQIIGTNSSAALVFNDQKAAEETLSALSAKPRVVAAFIFAADGRMLAKYVRKGELTYQTPAMHRGRKVSFEGNSLFVTSPVTLDREVIGSVSLQYDLEEMYYRIKSYAGIALTIMLVASAVALFLSSRLQRLISEPILKLAETARDISRDKRYSLRAERHGHDEIGTLIDDFNEMLSQIQQRDAKLERHRGFLEEQVAQRTAELLRANEELLAEMEERSRAEKALASEKERLAVTLRSIVEGVVATDLDGNIVLINKSGEEMAGWTMEQSGGKHLEDVFVIIDPKTRKPSRNTVAEVLRTGEVVGHIDHVILAKDGSERTIAHNGAPIRDKNGEIIGVIIAFRDITEKQKMEEELIKSQRLESIGILAGGIAHDFNNLLTAILGNISLAKMFVRGDEKVFGRLAEAEKASIRARDLTQQLLTFSKGGAPIKRSTSITELLVDSASFALSGSNVKCEFSLPEELWSAEIDEGQISQVVNNVIINADHAMTEGGLIKVSAENIVIGPGDPSVLKEGAYVKIAIADQGTGIPEEILPKIFDPYFTTKPKGSGLGLTTCYSIIKRHEGLITVESEVGAGTTFYIYLPASDKKASAERGAVEGPVHGRGRILIMDDEEIIREVAGTMLTHLGYEVGFARDGMEAIELYAKARSEGRPFDVVIIDLTIPGGMGGKEAIQKLVEIDPGVRAIVSSGYSHGPIMSEYRKFGFCGVAAKPYRIEDLSRAVREAITEKT